MKARVIGIILFAVVLAAAPGARQPGGAAGGQTPPTAKSPAPRRAVIVTGENSFNGHVWKDTSAEIKSILEPHRPEQPEAEAGLLTAERLNYSSRRSDPARVC